MADADRLVAALRYIDEQRPADPLESFRSLAGLKDAYKRRVQPIINNAAQTFSTGGPFGDLFRSYGDAAAPGNAAALQGMGIPFKGPMTAPREEGFSSGENFRPMGDPQQQFAGQLLGDPMNVLPMVAPAARGAVAAGKYAGPELARALENYMGKVGMRPSMLEGSGGILDTGVSPSITGISSDAAPILPRSSGMYTPGIAQENLPRLTDAGKVPKFNERTQGVLESGTARKKTTDLIAKGKELRIQEWYGTEPLRQFAMNEGLTQAEFDRMLAHLASASQRNPVSQQNRMGSVLWKMDRQGELNPDVQLLTNKLKRTGGVPGEGMIELPPTYGSLAQGAIFDRSKQIASGDIMGALPTDKKLGTFYQNLKGNLTPVTVDVNALRGPVMASKRPDWLATKLVEKDEFGNITNSYTPRADYDAGRLTMKDALYRPGFWEAAPKGPGEYSGIERLWQNAAKREGVAPAEAQALGWYGSGDITALKSKPELYIENLERLARNTAEREGISPVQAMRNFVLGNKQLGNAKPEMLGAIAVGGASAAAISNRNK